jgi:2-C-methyl-D-erythritol 4-phosphate cytidylyltransferase
MNICVIIPAAGRSTRFGESDKLSQDLGGRPVLIRTVEAFTKREEVRSIIVAGPPGDFDAFRARFGPTLSFHGVRLVQGGAHHRWETVKNALTAVPEDATHIAVHDAARPHVPDDVLSRVFQAAEKLDAVIPAVNISATVKRVAEEAVDVGGGDDDAVADVILGDAGRLEIHARAVLETIDRTRLVEVQTPQVFAAQLLKQAYAQSNLEGATDDASLVERLGKPVHVVEGDARNIKITHPADLRLMRAILGVAAPAERPVHMRF